MRIVLASIAFALCATVLPLSAQAVAQHYQLNIQRQPLEAALMDFAHQTGFQVARFSDTIDGSELVGPVNGEYSLEQALTSLLASSGLTYRLVNERMIAVLRPDRLGGAGRQESDNAPGATAWDGLVQLAQANQDIPATSPMPQQEDSSENTTAGQSQDRSEAQTLDTIVVTAQKREEKMIDVPMSISAFTADRLEDIGAADLTDFIGTVPGVDFRSSGDGFQTIHIRGIAPTLNDVPIGFYLDELPFTFLGAPFTPDVRTYDLERVEVLRGPQGTLYGDGSLGGTIRILTANPDLQEFQASVDLTTMDTTDGESSYGAKAMANVPIKQDVLGLRVVATKEELGGWIDSTFNGVEDYNDRDVDTYRAKLRLTPTDRLDVTLSAWHSRQQVDGNTLARQDRTTPIDPVVNDVEYDLYSATVKYEFDAFDLLSATSLMDFSFGQVTSFFGFPFVQDDNSDILSEELRLTSNSDGVFRWTAGLFYRKIERELDALFGVAGEPGAIPDMTATTAESYAVFGEGTWSLLDEKMEVTLGLRYFEDDRTTDTVVDPATLAEIQAIDPTFTGQEQGTYDTISPRFNIAFHPNEDWLLYTNIAKGFRSGQIQSITSLITAARNGFDVPVNIDEETLWSYEAGTKASFANGRVVLEGAVYYNDWDNLQTQILVDPVAVLSALVNAGPARTQGIELGVTLQPVRGLSLQLAGSHLDGEYQEDVPGTTIRAGGRIRNVPETTASASATYRWPLAGSLYGFVHGGVQYSSAKVDDPATRLPSDALTEIDLRIGVEGESWAVYLFGDNLTDEDGATFPVVATNLTATRLRPRTYGVNLRYNFN